MLHMGGHVGGGKVACNRESGVDVHTRISHPWGGTCTAPTIHNACSLD